MKRIPAIAAAALAVFALGGEAPAQQKTLQERLIGHLAFRPSPR